MTAAAVTTAERDLPGVPGSVRVARAMAREVLGAGHPAADVAALCVSELVTNSILYTRSCRPGGTVTVSVETWASPPAVWLRVRDDGSPGMPARLPRSARLPRIGASPEPGVEHGFGLRMVAALAAGWGADPGPDGTCTWCRFGGA